MGRASHSFPFALVGAVTPGNYILAMPTGSGDLVGCVYGSSGGATQTPGGTISNRAIETFIGCLGSRCGSFQLSAHITSKWNGQPGPPPADQVFGRCQHKIIAGSGTGDFAGVAGRLDFKDIILRDSGGVVIGVEYEYRGHLRG